jgi:hypothetical protein
MAFSKKPNHTIQIPSAEILNFSTDLTNIADVTVNLNEKLIKTASLLGISQNTLSKMMLSTDPLQLNNMVLINNLNVSLDNYIFDELPPQLIDYIDQIKIQLTNTSTATFEDLPSYFNLLLSNTSTITTIPITTTPTTPTTPITPAISYDYNYDTDEYETDDYETYNYSNDSNDNDKINLSSLIITPDLIKNDICVICFCQLNDTVIQTSCNHQYHLHCITQWHQIKNLCPLCKNVI